MPGSLTTEVSGGVAQVSPLDIKEMRIIGEAQQHWAPLRRKYNLFLYRNAPPSDSRPKSAQSQSSSPLSNSQAMDLTPYTDSGSFHQFAYVNEPFLSWDFSLLSSDEKLIGSVNRNFSGFGREIFTDTGVYALRMDAAGLAKEPSHLISQTGQKTPEVEQAPVTAMTLDQRAVMLATAVSVDFDYFSRKSGSGGGLGGWMPMWFPGGGGGGAAAGEAGAEAGAVEGAGAGGSRPMEEGAVVGAGSLAGYEAMQRGTGRDSGAFGDEVANASREEEEDKNRPSEPNTSDGGDFWSDDSSPWYDNEGGKDHGGGKESGWGSADGGDSGGGDGGGDWGDFFGE